MLKKIPVSRSLIEQLYDHGKITPEAKVCALEILYPQITWRFWAARLLLAIGSALALSGVVYFFAFNWAKITPFVKLASIQIVLIACIVGAYCYSLKTTIGKVCLLSASVLVGVFMAVFGQVYQTGADSYQLFMMWSLLILGWTIISNFAAQWILWLSISNTFILLWWDQAALPTREMEDMIYVFLTALNGFALYLREVFIKKDTMLWLRAKWIGALLSVFTLLPMLIPIIIFIFKPTKASASLFLATILGIAGHGLLYILYRYKTAQMWSLTALTLSVCIIIETSGLKLLTEIFNNLELVMFLLMAFMTLCIFTTAVIVLRRIVDSVEQR